MPRQRCGMSYLVRPARSADPVLSGFVASWSAGDRALRFGSPSASASEWLVRALQSGRNGALVAIGDDRIVGLLDFTNVGAQAEFGVFVVRDARRRGIGRALVEALLTRTPLPLAADCRYENTAAVALLRTLCFDPAARNGNEIHWMRRRGGECPRRPGSPSS